MPRSVDPNHYRERRDAILHEAYRQFAAAGYEGTSTASICRSAGISSGTFFHYFPTKLAALVGILEAGNEATRQQLLAITETGVAAVEAYARQYSAELADPSFGGFVHVIAGVERIDAVAALLQAERALVSTFLRTKLLAAPGEIRNDVSVDDLVTWTGWLFDGAAQNAAAGNAPDDLARAVRALLTAA